MPTQWLPRPRPPAPADAATTTSPSPPAARSASAMARAAPSSTSVASVATDPVTGRLVGHRVASGGLGKLEFHHVVSPRLGGDNSPANVRIHCRVHNAWQARAELGDERFARALDSDLQARRKKAPPG